MAAISARVNGVNKMAAAINRVLLSQKLPLSPPTLQEGLYKHYNNAESFVQ
jgi:hypothetical protein